MPNKNKCVEIVLLYQSGWHERSRFNLSRACVAQHECLLLFFHLVGAFRWDWLRQFHLWESVASIALTRAGSMTPIALILPTWHVKSLLCVRLDLLVKHRFVRNRGSVLFCLGARRARVHVVRSDAEPQTKLRKWRFLLRFVVFRHSKAWGRCVSGWWRAVRLGTLWRCWQKRPVRVRPRRRVTGLLGRNVDSRQWVWRINSGCWANFLAFTFRTFTVFFYVLVSTLLTTESNVDWICIDQDVIRTYDETNICTWL